MTPRQRQWVEPIATCRSCGNFRNGWCGQAKVAGLSRTRDRAEVGSDLASMPQRCSGHIPALKGRHA